MKDGCVKRLSVEFLVFRVTQAIGEFIQLLLALTTVDVG